MIGRARPMRSAGGGGRLLIAIVVALFAIGSYYFGTTKVQNPVTGEVQRVNMTTQPENRIGKIQDAIKAEFPNGVPDGLVQ